MCWDTVDEQNLQLGWMKPDFINDKPPATWCETDLVHPGYFRRTKGWGNMKGEGQGQSGKAASVTRPKNIRILPPKKY